MSAALWSQWAGLDRLRERAGERKRWFLSVGSFHSVGQMGLLRGSQSNLTREARALTQRGHEREKMEGTAQAFQGSQSGERPVSSTLATGCHTSDHSSQELKTPTLPWTVARAGMRQTLQPSFVHLPGLKPSSCNPSVRAACSWVVCSFAPGPAARLGGWFAIRATVISPTFPSPPGALGAWEIFQAWL